MKQISERELTRQIIQYAQLFGWLVYHQRPARTAKGWRTAIQGHKGFPDLILCHPASGEIIAAELKVGRNRPTPEQAFWLRSLAEAGMRAYIWKPEDWDAIEAILAGAPPGGAV